METVVANIGGRVRRETLHGRDYLVAPLKLLKVGVWAGSRGPLYYPKEENERDPSAWNGMPMLLRHPLVNGVPVSGRDPKVWEERLLGHVFNSKASGGDLDGEGWFDREATKRADPRVLDSLERGLPIELSTGLFVRDEPAPGDAVHNGTPYVGTARDHKPDHLAILPDEKGACPVSAGCGVNNSDQTLAGKLSAAWQKALELVGLAANSQPSHDELRSRLSDLVTARFGGPAAAYPGMSAPAVYLVDVFDSHLVYEANGKTWRLGYTTDLRSGAVALSPDAPEEVRKVTSYKPVANSDPEPEPTPPPEPEPTPEPPPETPAMPAIPETPKRREAIDYLTANCDCWKAQGDREVLANLSDEKLTALREQADRQQKRELVANAARQGFTDPAGNKVTFDEQANAWVTQPSTPSANLRSPEGTKPQTAAEWLAAAPPEVQGLVRNAQEAERREKQAIAERLLANVADQQVRQAKGDRLMAKPLEELRELAELVQDRVPQPGPSYLGQSVPAFNAGLGRDDSQNLLPSFDTDFTPDAAGKRA